MLFITRSLLAGKGRPIRFQRQGQRKRAKDALAAVLAAHLQTRREISRIISPPNPPAVQVTFRPWMLPARGPRRSKQRNPARTIKAKKSSQNYGGCVVKANMPQHRYLSSGWYDIRLASGWDGGDDRPRLWKWGPLICPGWCLDGLGRVLGLWCFTRRSSTVEIFKWRKEGGWHSDQDKH